MVEITVPPRFFEKGEVVSSRKGEGVLVETPSYSGEGVLMGKKKEVPHEGVGNLQRISEGSSFLLLSGKLEGTNLGGPLLFVKKSTLQYHGETKKDLGENWSGGDCLLISLPKQRGRIFHFERGGEARKSKSSIQWGKTI